MLAISNRRQRGTSLIELMAVVGIVITLSAFAIMSTMRPTATSRANNAVDAVVSTLIQGRQLAISKRRNVLVTFTGTNQILLTVQTLPGEAVPTPLPIVRLNDGISTALQFYVFNSLPNTPMGPLGFGNTSAIDLQAVNGGGAPSAVMFSTSGGLVGAIGRARRGVEQGCGLRPGTWEVGQAWQSHGTGWKDGTGKGSEQRKRATPDGVALKSKDFSELSCRAGP